MVFYRRQIRSGEILAGEILKKRREDLGLNIREISERLRINADYLYSIENEIFERLPAPVYTVGYLKKYAEFLNIDAGPILQFYKDHLEEPKPTTLIPVAYSKRKTPKILYLIPVFFFLVIFLIAKPYLLPKQPEIWHPGESKTSALIPKAAPVEAPVAKTVPEEDIQKDNVPGYVQIVETKVPASVVEAKAKPVAEDMKSEKNLSSGHSLNISVTEETWISIKFGNARAIQMVLMPGETKSWKFSEKAALKIGNAGGIKLNLDGKDLGAPGLSGQVKTLSLPDNQDING